MNRLSGATVVEVRGVPALALRCEVAGLDVTRVETSVVEASRSAGRTTVTPSRSSPSSSPSCASSTTITWTSALRMSASRPVPRRVVFRPTSTCSPKPAAASWKAISGVLSSSTPTCGGRSGSSSAPRDSTRREATPTYSRHDQRRSPASSPGRSSSARASSSSRTVLTVGSDGLGREQPAHLPSLVGGAAEHELEELGGGEVPVRLAVEVDADAAVHVHGGVRQLVAGVGRPELRRGDLLLGREALLEPPRRLPQGELGTEHGDVPVGQPLRHRLERADGASELLAGAGVLRGEVERAL